MIDSCVTSARERTNSRETLLPSEFPSRPWSSVAADLFQIESKQYLVIFDYFSSFFEVAHQQRRKLWSSTSSPSLHAMEYPRWCILTMVRSLLLSVSECSHRSGVSAS